MRRFLNFSLKFVMIFAIVFASVFGAKTISKNSLSLNALATGDNEPQDINMSIFIKDPTYSCLIGDKIFFIDAHDNILKVYNTVNSYFEEQFLDVSNYEIKDAEVLNDSLYLIVSSSETKNKIVQIKLAEFDGEKYNTSFEVVEFDYEFDSAYETIFVQNLTFGEDDYLLVSLTPVDNETSPLMVVFDEQNEATDITISFGTEQEAVTIQNNLIKIFTIQDDDEELFILFAYTFDGGAKISYVSVETYEGLINYYNSAKISTGITVLTSDLLKNLGTAEVYDVNFMTFDSESHIVVTYKDEDSYWLGFTPNILLDPDEFDLVGTHECYNAKYMLINNDVITYSKAEEQELYYSTISHDPDGVPGSLIQPFLVKINNPDCEITYFSEDNFVYKKTTKETPLLLRPWDFEELVNIDENQDLIYIGTIQIKRAIRSLETIQIEDYDYCLYTHGGKNYLGYVKNSDLVQKDKVEIKDSKYTEIVTVWPNTTIYSLPTNIVGTYITSDLNSQKIGEIVENSKVKIIDLLSSYTSNGIKFVKVLVNDKTIGYIDASRIYSPKDKVDFVITNATIEQDDTKVYLSADESSVVTHILSKGKQVRIDGTRDTKSGFTKITFNDEYGNEFTGYVSSDYVKADSWSTLQIIGSILIAVNIGLLVLIFVYKNKHVLKSNIKENQEENS